MEHLEGVQGARASTRRSRSCRPATTSSACSPRRSCSKRCALRLEKQGTSIRRDGHHRHLLRRHRVHAAVDPLRHRGVARPGRLHDADLRQHADGPGLLASRSRPQKATRSATTPRSRGPWSRSSTSTTTTSVVDYGETGRVKLTTLTKEFFVPGFLERDEGERETAVREVSLGRRQRRAAVPRDCGDDDRGRVLRPYAANGSTRSFATDESSEISDAQHSRSPLGQAVRVARSRRGRPLRHRRADRQGQPGQRRPARSATCARPQRARDVLREIPIDELIERVEEGRRAVLNADAAAGRRHADRPTSSPSSSRPRTGLPEHMCRANMKKNALRADEHGQDSRLPDARARPRTS